MIILVFGWPVSLHITLKKTRLWVYLIKILVEAESALRLGQRAKEIGGVDGYCLQRYAEALEVIPYTLAENAPLNPIDVVTNLRKLHNGGDKNAGINVRKV